MQLVCHTTIPGSGYTSGQVITDANAIAEIRANESLYRGAFQQVPDGTFPVNKTAPAASYVTPTSTSVSSSSASSSSSSTTSAS